MMNDENGRSMVEMLGVLAIIGVLSVAGIAGYSMAMRKLKANNIIDLASKARIVAYAGNFGSGKAYSDSELDSLIADNKPSELTMCATSAGIVKYFISDDALFKVVKDNAPSDWMLAQANEASVSC